jgi:hypothetical protein
LFRHFISSPSPAWKSQHHNTHPKPCLQENHPPVPATQISPVSHQPLPIPDTLSGAPCCGVHFFYTMLMLSQARQDPEALKASKVSLVPGAPAAKGGYPAHADRWVFPGYEEKWVYQAYADRWVYLGYEERWVYQASADLLADQAQRALLGQADLLLRVVRLVETPQPDHYELTRHFQNPPALDADLSAIVAHASLVHLHGVSLRAGLSCRMAACSRII